MLLSWVYELTPEGVVRTEDLDPVQARSVQRATGRILDFIIIGVLLLVIAMLIVGRRPFYRQTGESISQKSIAVLPFENLSRDPDNAYFATGIQNEILTHLAKIAALKVISQTSTQQYPSRPGNLRGIARQLGVAHVLEDSVQKAADQCTSTCSLFARQRMNIFGLRATTANWRTFSVLNAKYGDFGTGSPEGETDRCRRAGSRAKTNEQSRSLRCLFARVDVCASSRLLRTQYPRRC